jgi:hypothetical protein
MIMVLLEFKNILNFYVNMYTSSLYFLESFSKRALYFGLQQKQIHVFLIPNTSVFIRKPMT